MKTILLMLISPSSTLALERSLRFMHIGVGILTMLHGLPKITGGFSGWQQIGVTFMGALGIHFLPTLWGLCAAIIEFFGGIALVLGLGVRLASSLLAFIMIIAAAWHIQRGDPFNVYSFPLTLVVIFIGFAIAGSKEWSIDYYMYQKNSNSNLYKNY